MYQLFLLEQQVRGLRTRQDAATRRLTAQKTKLGQLEQQLQEMTGQLKQVQAKAGTLETEAKSADAKIQHLRDQMNTVKNNREYSALLLEVSTLKAEKGKVEDQALAEMERVESLKKEHETLAAKVAEQVKIVHGAETEVEAAKREVGDQLDEVTAKRDDAQKELPADSLAQFRRLTVVHDGEALAAVVEESRRHMEYSCGGCYMSIPVERVNSLMMKPNDLSFCPNCGRILFMEPELKSSFAKS
jgi:predicted  nucleic acid-binding Zn-ribbon protein